MTKNIGLMVLLVLSLVGCGDTDESADAKSKPAASGDAKASSDGKTAAQQTAQKPGGDKTKAKSQGQGRGPGQGRGRGKNAKQVADLRAQFKNRPVPVAVTEVERGRADAFYFSSASLTAEEEAAVVARTQGVVVEIFVEEGDLVSTGSALAQLDTRRLALEVARTRTNIESFERALQRSKKLFESKMISPDAYDQAHYNVEREKATFNLQLYELEEATIKAPIDGVVTHRHIKLGNTLSANDPAFEIKRSAVVEAILNVPEKEMIKMAPGHLAVVQVDALNKAQFEGVVERVAPEVDPDSGTFRVTVSLNNPDNVLKPGMFARVNVRYDSNEDTLLVARAAVVTQKDENAVFVVKEGQAIRQAVVLGYNMGNLVEIIEGVSEGDQIVISGQGGLRDGTSVRVVSL